MAQGSAVGTIVTTGILAGLAYWAYETFFATPAAPALGPAPLGTNLTPTPKPAVVVNTPPPAVSGTCPTSGILAKLLANMRAGKGDAGVNFGPLLPGTNTLDEYDFYLEQLCTGLSAQVGLDPDVAFPGDPDRGGPMNWSAFEGLARQKGLSGYRLIGTRPVRRWM